MESSINKNRSTSSNPSKSTAKEKKLANTDSCPIKEFTEVIKLGLRVLV